MENAPLTSMPADAAKWFSLLSAYSIFIGVLYLWGYWSVFHVPILEYLSISDVVKAAALPMASACAFAVFGNLTATTLVGPHGAAKGLALRVGHVAQRFGFWLGVLSALAVAMAFLFEFEYRWSVVTLVVISPLMYAAGRTGFLGDVIFNAEMRAVLLVVAISMPSTMYEHGRAAAHEVTGGTAFDYVVLAGTTSTSSDNLTPLQRLRFIGHAGDVYFLWNPVTTALTLTKLDSKAPIEIVHWVASPDVKAPWVESGKAQSSAAAGSAVKRAVAAPLHQLPASA